MAVYERNGIWKVGYINDEGKRKDISFGRGEEAMEEARKFNELVKSRHLANKNAQNSNTVSVPTPLKQITLKDLCNEYLEHMTVSGRTKNHINSMRAIFFGIALPYFGESILINDIDYSQHILPFINMLKTESSFYGHARTPRTINHYANYMISLFNYAVERGYLISNPMKLWKKLKVVRKERELTLEDTFKIMRYAAPHVKWAMEVAYHLGVRPGPCELFNLTWDDVDFTKKHVHIYASKTNTHRYIPISDSFRDRLKEKNNESETNYIIEYKGKKVKTISRAFRYACKQAGISYPVRMYDLRHLFATLMMNSGADLAAVSKLMGHARISTTADNYYESRGEEMVKAIKGLPEIPSGYLTSN